MPFRQRTGVRMFDSIVDEPRLSAWWRVEEGRPEPIPLLHDIRLLLAERYDEPFDSIGFNLYRDGNDSVAWHGDRHRHVVTNPVIAILSVGAPRPAPAAAARWRAVTELEPRQRRPVRDGGRVSAPAGNTRCPRSASPPAPASASPSAPCDSQRPASGHETDRARYAHRLRDQFGWVSGRGRSGRRRRNRGSRPCRGRCTSKISAAARCSSRSACVRPDLREEPVTEVRLGLDHATADEVHVGVGEVGSDREQAPDRHRLLLEDLQRHLVAALAEPRTCLAASVGSTPCSS